LSVSLSGDGQMTQKQNYAPKVEQREEWASYEGKLRGEDERARERTVTTKSTQTKY
jgi:hypothetical protein